MFEDARVLDRQRTAASFQQGYARYSDAAEKWFDGSVGSIDRRIAANQKLQHAVNFTVARLDASAAHPYLRVASALRGDLQALDGLKEALLTGASSYQEPAPRGYREADKGFMALPEGEQVGDEALAAPEQSRHPHLKHVKDWLMEEPTGPGHGMVAGNWFSGDPTQFNTNPNDYSSRQEWMDANNLGGYIQDAQQKHPPSGWDEQANDYAVPSLEHDMTKSDHPSADPTVNVSVPRNLPRTDAGRGPGSDYAGGRERFEPSPAGVPDSRAGARLAGVDRRWVTLEAAKFVAANPDALDDSRELALRAHNHAALQTSTFTQVRSAAVCEAFVATVVDLGYKTYRPPVQRTAAFQDFAAEAIYLC